jgi:hypothetical protein
MRARTCRPLLACGSLAATLAAAACATRHAPVAAPPESAPAPPAADPGPPPKAASLVNAVVVVGACPDAAKMDARRAEQAIRKLVGSCPEVPGGRAHFSATLLPNGKIELASPEGNPAEGVVPTCVLQHLLVHQVALGSPCKFDVALWQSAVVEQAKDGG